jgi:hypothetical protein
VFSAGHVAEQFLELPQAADFVLRASPQFGVSEGLGSPAKESGLDGSTPQFEYQLSPIYPMM